MKRGAERKKSPRLHTPKSKSEGDSHFLCGTQPVREVLLHAPERVTKLYVATPSKLKEFLPIAKKVGVPLQEIPKEKLSQLIGSTAHQDVACELLPREYLSPADFLIQHETSRDVLVVLLDQVQDPHNLGAILRACEVYGVQAVGWPRSGSAPLSLVAMRSAVGASELLTFIDAGNLAQTLERFKSAGFWVIAADERGESSSELAGVIHAGKRVLVMGAEGAGLRRLTREKADYIWSLQTKGHISSLNVSQAAAVCLSEMQFGART